MSGNKRNHINHEKNIKLRLINSRKIIQNKFKKAFNDRVSLENGRKEKFRPIINAIDKLAEQKDKTKKNRFEKNYYDNFNDDFNHDPIYDSVANSTINSPRYSPANSETGSNHSQDTQSMRSEVWTSSSDSSSDSDISDMDFTQFDEPDEHDINEAGPSNRQPAEKRKDRSDDENDINVMSNIADDDETLTESNKAGKRYRLSKSEFDKFYRKMDQKLNRKLVQLQRVEDLNENVKEKRKEKSINARDQISLIPSNDNDAVIILDSDEEMPSDRNPSFKRQKAVSFQPNKFKRVMPTPISAKIRGRYCMSEIQKAKGKPKPKSKLPTPYNQPSVAVYAPAIINPYLTRYNRENVRQSVTKFDQITNFHNEKAKSKVKEIEEKKKKTGAGIETDFIPYNENIVHEFYDDPNELCERLHLLIASKAAGNSNHSQEINSIIAELRESGIIA